MFLLLILFYCLFTFGQEKEIERSCEHKLCLDCPQLSFYTLITTYTYVDLDKGGIQTFRHVLKSPP